MLTLVMVIGGLVIAVGCFVGGVTAGYEWGVNETEGRWSDAVAKAEWSERYPTSTPKKQ